MLRIFLFSVLFVSIFTPNGLSQVLDAEKSNRRSYDVADLTGPVKSVVMERAGFSDKPNEAGHYVEENRKYTRTVFFNKEGTLTGAMPFERKFRCGTKDYEEVKRTELHDARGRKIGVIEEGFGHNNTLLSKIIYEYDALGQTRAFSWTLYDALGTIEMIRIVKNDAQGNVIETSMHGKYGLLTSRHIYIRNEKGLEVESLEYGPADLRPISRVTTSYEYDDFGNWRKLVRTKLVTEDGNTFFKPMTAEYRAITYYSSRGEQ